MANLEPQNEGQIRAYRDPLLWLLLLLSFAYRYLLIKSGVPAWYYTDGSTYFSQAQQLVTQGNFGEGLGQVPGYPIFLAMSYLVGGTHWRFYAALFQHALAWIGLALLYSASLRYFRDIAFRRVLAFGVGAFYLYIRFPIYDHSILADSLFTFWVICQSYLLIRYLQGPRRLYLILLGIAFGLSMLTKPVDQLGWVIALLAIGIRLRSWKKWFRASLYLVIPILLITAPWLARNYLRFGFLGLSPYSKSQLLLRAGPLLDRDKAVADFKAEPLFQDFSETPHEYSVQVLTHLAEMGDSKQSRPAENYQRLLRLYFKKRMVFYIEQYGGYRNTVPSWVFMELKKVGFGEMELIAAMGDIAREILGQNGGQGWKDFFRQSLMTHIPDMMMFGGPGNIEYANVKSIPKKIQAKQNPPKVSQKILVWVNDLVYRPNLFVWVTPLALFGYLLALLRVYSIAFTSYAVLRIAYFPLLISVFGRGLERYRLPIDHLLAMGLALLVWQGIELIKWVKRVLMRRKPSIFYKNQAPKAQL